MNLISNFNKNLLHSLALSSFIATMYVVAAIRFPFDYPWHASEGERLLSAVDGEMAPHFLWHVLLIFTHKISNSSFLTASFINVFVCVFITSLIVSRNFQKKITTSKWLISVFTLAVFFVHPVPLTYLHDGLLYIGYFTPNIFHNPTLILLKPIALLHFVLFCTVLKDNHKNYSGSTIYIALGLLLALSAIAKPSYIVIFLPSIGLVVLANMIFRQYPAISPIRLMLICGTLLPGLAVLLWQYLYFFVGHKLQFLLLGLPLQGNQLLKEYQYFVHL